MKTKDFSRLFILSGIAVMAACGGGSGSDNDDDNADCTGGFITIDPIDPVQGGSVTVTGTAFASDSWYCDFTGTCYPGVEVSYQILNSGYTGTADSHFSGWTGRHSWTATVLLASGENRIRFKAEGGGVYCAKTVAVSAARTRVLQIYPANLAEKVHEYSVIAVRIDGEVDPSKFDEKSIIVSDNFGVAINGNIEFEFETDNQLGTLIFTPDYPLAPATQYRVNLKADIFLPDEGGTSSGYSWVFTTWNY